MRSLTSSDRHIAWPSHRQTVTSSDRHLVWPSPRLTVTSSDRHLVWPSPRLTVRYRIELLYIRCHVFFVGTYRWRYGTYRWLTRSLGHLSAAWRFVRPDTQLAAAWQLVIPDTLAAAWRLVVPDTLGSSVTVSSTTEIHLQQRDNLLLRVLQPRIALWIIFMYLTF